LLSRRVLQLLSLLIIMLGTSCVSYREQKLREFKEAPLFGMVYDYDQKPCPAASVQVDGEERAQTDINGRFVIDELSRGEHRIEVRKKGYEELGVAVQFLNRDQILYMRMISLGQLLAQAEEALERRRLEETASLLSRAQKIDAGDPLGQYITALYLLEKGSPAQAAEILESLVRRGYREAILYLSLADIFQYRLHNSSQAAASLRAYLELQNDPDVRARLEELGDAK
jgi:hypothetical protein